jgi:hypothetical protein
LVACPSPLEHVQGDALAARLPAEIGPHALAEPGTGG